MTPMGYSIIEELINNDPTAFLKAVTSASITGVNPSDIFAFIPQLPINICSPEYKGFAGKIMKIEDLAADILIKTALKLGTGFCLSCITGKKT